MTLEGLRGVLAVVPPEAPLVPVVGQVVDAYRKAVGYEGRYVVEYHLVVDPDRSVEDRIRMPSRVRQCCDLVVWHSSCEHVGRALKDHLEQAQAREPGSIHHGSIKLLTCSEGRPVYETTLEVPEVSSGG